MYQSTNLIESITPTLSLDTEAQLEFLEKLADTLKVTTLTHHQGLAHQQRKKVADHLGQKDAQDAQMTYVLLEGEFAELGFNEGCCRIIRAIIDAIECPSVKDNPTAAILKVTNYPERITNYRWPQPQHAQNALETLRRDIGAALSTSLA